MTQRPMVSRVGGTLEPMTDAEFADWTDGASEPLPPRPIVLTKLQLLAALDTANFITKEEALAAGRFGAVPSRIDEVFGSLPQECAHRARLTWATMTQVPRDHQLISMMIAANLATAEEVDAIFALGASIT